MKFIKNILKCLGIILLFFIIIVELFFFTELKRSNGNPVKAVSKMFKNVANNVTNSEPIYVLFLGQNKDLGQTLTDTIICLGYTPREQKAFMVSIPRDTFIRKKYFECKT